MTITAKPKQRLARGMGNRAEALLSKQLTDLGYEVRRTHLSAFPDLVVWNEDDLLFIEVKARSKPQDIRKAVTTFRADARLLKVAHKDAILLCYVQQGGQWSAFAWFGGETIQVRSLVG
jgi:Holliday junction resolvase-like predicted endonuclease